VGRKSEEGFFKKIKKAQLQQKSAVPAHIFFRMQRHDVDLTWTPDVVELLIMDYDKYYGARSLQHSVNRHVVNPLVRMFEST
jgi:ATP-dependent Clp protease ATP-binding subunit ClpA